MFNYQNKKIPKPKNNMGLPRSPNSPVSRQSKGGVAGWMPGTGTRPPITQGPHGYPIVTNQVSWINNSQHSQQPQQPQKPTWLQEYMPEISIPEPPKPEALGNPFETAISQLQSSGVMNPIIESISQAYANMHPYGSSIGDRGAAQAIAAQWAQNAIPYAQQLSRQNYGLISQYNRLLQQGRIQEANALLAQNQQAMNLAQQYGIWSQAFPAQQQHLNWEEWFAEQQAQQAQENWEQQQQHLEDWHNWQQQQQHYGQPSTQFYGELPWETNYLDTHGSGELWTNWPWPGTEPNTSTSGQYWTDIPSTTPTTSTAPTWSGWADIANTIAPTGINPSDYYYNWSA